MDLDRTDGHGAGRAVWTSDMLLQGQNRFGFSCAAYERDLQAFAANLRRIDRGEPVPDDFVPDLLWAKERNNDLPKRLPHLFQACGFLVVSETLADILRRFELGTSRLRPVTLLRPDRVAPLPGTHFILDLRERKEAFEPEHSRKYEPRLFPDQTHLGTTALDPQDDDIAVSAAALAGADVWKDPRLLRSLFFSGGLTAAMREAKMLGGVRTFRCPVVTVH